MCMHICKSVSVVIKWSTSGCLTHDADAVVASFESSENEIINKIFTQDFLAYSTPFGFSHSLSLPRVNWWRSLMMMMIKMMRNDRIGNLHNQMHQCVPTFCNNRAQQRYRKGLCWMARNRFFKKERESRLCMHILLMNLYLLQQRRDFAWEFFLIVFDVVLLLSFDFADRNANEWGNLHIFKWDSAVNAQGSLRKDSFFLRALICVHVCVQMACKRESKQFFCALSSF